MANVNGTMVLVPPPPGYVVDFANPQRQLMSAVYTVVVMENMLAFAFLLQRMFTRMYLMRLFQVEDGKITPNTKSSSRTPLTNKQRLSLLPGCYPRPHKQYYLSVGIGE